ncbi:hypothetical protein Fmac_016320 [Flemingia macrophylla]|uniref:Gnk2-homologous domain-containing protein n=1 Tax=Flemingia macrophylla TaxID=520843 RepID=A0ABD1MH58_9FABA
MSEEHVADIGQQSSVQYDPQMLSQIWSDIQGLQEGLHILNINVNSSIHRLQEGLNTLTTNNTITVAYQCRDDLFNADRHACVAKIPAMLPALCGADVAATRVQLAACYLRYQAVGFGQAPSTQLLYKACDSRTLADVAGFEAKREATFHMAENDNGLFYTGSYQSLYVLVQCEGSLGNACGDCVRSATEQAKTASRISRREE